MNGVENTIVGYCGGKQPNPTYRQIKDYTESIRIEYDPNVVSYNELVYYWSKLHSPTRKWFSKQYRSAIFYGNENEKDICLGIIKSIEESEDVKIHSDIEPLSETEFYRAEEYHQHYLSK